MMPNHQATLVAGGHGAAMETEELSHTGFMVLIAFIASCHVIATMILYYGITGQYKKATVTDCGKSNKEKVKQALKDMLTQISLKKQFLITPLTIYSAAVLCFIQTDVTRHLITPCLGISNVPLIMITYGVGIRFVSCVLAAFSTNT